MEEKNIPSHRCLGDGEPQYKQYELCCSTGDCAYKGSEDSLRPSCNYNETTHARFLSDLEEQRRKQ